MSRCQWYCCVRLCVLNGHRLPRQFLFWHCHEYYTIRSPILSFEVFEHVSFTPLTYERLPNSCYLGKPSILLILISFHSNAYSGMQVTFTIYGNYRQSRTAQILKQTPLTSKHYGKSMGTSSENLIWFVSGAIDFLHEFIISIMTEELTIVKSNYVYQIRRTIKEALIWERQEVYISK